MSPLLRPLKALKPAAGDMFRGAIDAMATPGSGPLALAQAAQSAIGGRRSRRLEQLEQELAAQKAQTDRIKAETDSWYKDRQASTSERRADAYGTDVENRGDYNRRVADQGDVRLEQGASRLTQAQRDAYWDTVDAARKRGDVPPTLDQYESMLGMTSTPQAAPAMAPMTAANVARTNSQAEVNQANVPFINARTAAQVHENELDQKFGKDDRLLEQARMRATTNAANALANQRNNPDPEGMSPRQSIVFNRITGDYMKSPVMAARDKMALYSSAIENAAAAPSPQNDLALVYSFVKALDHGDSAVREGELRLAMETLNMRQQVEANYQRLLTTKGLLPPDVRQNYIIAMRGLLDQFGDAAAGKEAYYRSWAKANGLDPIFDGFLRDSRLMGGVGGPVSGPAAAQPSPEDVSVLSGIGATWDDVLETALESGKTPQQVMQDIRSRAAGSQPPQ